MSPEHLLILVVVALVVLLQLLSRLLRRRARGLASAEPAPPGPLAPAPVRTMPAPVPVRRRRAGGAPPSVVPLPPREAHRSRRRPAVRIATAREARRGIVLITVLGPCRGLAPPGWARRGEARD